MNTHLSTIIAAGTPQLVIIIFWVLLLLWGIGALGWSNNPNWPRANGVVIIILFAILGWSVFRFGF